METPKETCPELLSLAAHELRNSGSVVIGYLRMLQADKNRSLTPLQRKMIDEMAKGYARWHVVVEEMSTVGKIDGRSFEMKLQTTDAFSLVAEVAGLVHEAKDREVRLEVRGPGDGAPLVADPALLRHSFDGIFRAIVREKPSNSTVVVERRIEKMDGRAMAVLIVAEADSVQAAYDREPGPLFYLNRGGVGLALAIARRVIEGLGGRLWSPFPVEGLPQKPGEMPKDPLTRGSAIISLPITESAS